MNYFQFWKLFCIPNILSIIISFVFTLAFLSSQNFEFDVPFLIIGVIIGNIIGSYFSWKNYKLQNENENKPEDI